MLNITDAAHEETALDSSTLMITKLACSLVGKTQPIQIKPDSLAHKAYDLQKVEEKFVCNYGLNPKFREKIAKGHLMITGVDLEEEVRIVEILDHPFFVATLFQPQISSRQGKPHPLFVACLEAARLFQIPGRKI